MSGKGASSGQQEMSPSATTATATDDDCVIHRFHVAVPVKDGRTDAEDGPLAANARGMAGLIKIAPTNLVSRRHCHQKGGREKLPRLREACLLTLAT